ASRQQGTEGIAKSEERRAKSENVNQGGATGPSTSGRCRLRQMHEPAAGDREAGPLESARALAPLVASCADLAEAGRRLPDALVDAFVDARLFQMYVPKVLGGDEVDYVE